jgi:hypothetical protein
MWRPCARPSATDFADWCRYWAELAEPRANPVPKTGVLLDLKDGARSE